MGKNKQRAGVGNTKPPAASKSANGNSTKDKNNGGGSSSKSGSDIGFLFALFFGVPFCTIKLVVWSLVSVPFWVLMQPLRLIFGRPPILQSWSQSWRFLQHYTWFSPTLPTRRKVFLTFAILEHTIRSPIFAVCWIVDEVLYGRQLKRVKLGGESDGNDDGGIEMVFVVSGYRSASTHLARSLLEDESISIPIGSSLSFASPNSMMMSLPYLWIWNYVSWFVGDLAEKEEGTKTSDDAPNIHPTLSKSQVRKWYREKYSPECLERHDFDPFSIDTLDLSFLSCHLNGLAWEYCLESKSSEVVCNEFHYGRHTTENKDLYEVDFVRYIDRLARKTILFHQPKKDTTNPKTAVLFKGHFLSIVPALRSRYPSAKFVTVLRDPCDRLKSAINYTAVNPSISPIMNLRNHGHWQTLATTLEKIEAEYCLQELKTFSTANSDSGRFLSIHYDALVTPSKQKDTIRAIQGWIVGSEGSLAPVQSKAGKSNAKKPLANAKKAKKTKKYTVDKTLHELGIDEINYRNHLSEYTDYMNEIGKKKKIA